MKDETSICSDYFISMSINFIQLKTIKKKLVRKALDMIRRIAEDDPEESDEKEGM